MAVREKCDEKILGSRRLWNLAAESAKDGAGFVMLVPARSGDLSRPPALHTLGYQAADCLGYCPPARLKAGLVDSPISSDLTDSGASDEASR